MEKQNLVIISAFVIILIGIVLLGTLADQEAKLTELATINNDTFTGSNATCTQITTACIGNLNQLTNATGGQVISPTNYTLCRTATNNLDGIILDTNSEFHGRTVNATYGQSPECTYVANSTATTLTDLIIIFFVLGILGAAIYGAYLSGLMDYVMGK